jgi:hypothetical protein
MTLTDAKIGHSSIAAALIAFLLVITIGVAHAEWDFWLKNGGTKIIKCAGNTEGIPVKLANPDGQWIYIDGIGSCKESGSSYIVEIKFLKVSVNSARSGDIIRERDPMKFDWIGVELYRQLDGQERIEWLFHDEKPIQGSLPNLADKRIVFGKLQFSIPKSAADRATRMTFYLTAQNIPFRFFVL